MLFFHVWEQNCAKHLPLQNHSTPIQDSAPTLHSIEYTVPDEAAEMVSEEG